MSPSDPGHPYGRGMGPPYPPQPIEIDMNHSRTLPSPAASAPMSASNAWDSSVYQPGLGEISLYAPTNLPRQLQTDNQVSGTNPHPLVNWYTSDNGPWIPKVIAEGIPDDRQSRARVGQRVSNVYGNQYRNPVLSDAGSYPYGTPTSDSGYGSNGPRRSDGVSIFSTDLTDQDQDLQSLTGHVADYQPYHQGMGEVLQSRDTQSNEQWAASLLSNTTSESTSNLICDTCKKSVKTRSELKYDTRTPNYI
jgi:hypothetical protein